MDPIRKSVDVTLTVTIDMPEWGSPAYIAAREYLLTENKVTQEEVDEDDAALRQYFEEHDPNAAYSVQLYDTIAREYAHAYMTYPQGGIASVGRTYHINQIGRPSLEAEVNCAHRETYENEGGEIRCWGCGLVLGHAEDRK
jgi:hypothetical protein